jgi:hypothetical protein
MIMARKNTAIGDIFSVKIDEHTQKFMQYIVSDMTQLNSDVIRVFNQEYPLNASPNVLDIVSKEVQFYAHCVTILGVKMGCWSKFGNCTDVGNFNHLLFRDTDDYGNPDIRVSNDWWIWKINKEMIHVGKLEGENRNAEIGVVFSPPNIVHRVKTGVYPGLYPTFE